MPKNNTVSESKVLPGFLTITLSVIGRFFWADHIGRALYQNNSVVCLPVACLSSVVTRVHCAKRAEPIGTNFGMSVSPDENSTSSKFCDVRLMGWGTVPPNDPRNGQIRAFSCTVAERVIRLRRFSAECWFRQGT